MSSALLAPGAGHGIAGLDPLQSEAVFNPARTLAIVAGAGSGKTRVLTQRIARRIHDGSAGPKHVLAVTFTNKAACELRSRLRVLLGHEVFPPPRRAFRPDRSEGPAVHTLHALGYAIGNRYWAGSEGSRSNQRITRRRSALLQDALSSVNEPSLGVTALGTEVEWAKARALSPAEYAAAAESYRRAIVSGGQRVELTTVARAFEAYEVIKHRRGVIDIDDLIVRAIDLLGTDPAFLATQRYWYRHVFVDEYQDLNPAQFRLLRLLVGDDPDLCVVGDANQAIYGWNGADPNLLPNFTKYFPAAQVCRLDANYRCRRPIVAAAASILDLPVAPVREGAESGCLPTLWSFEDPGAEAEGVARAVQRAVYRYRPSGVAVLAPTARQLDAVAAALTARRVPFERAGSSLLSRPEVERVLNRLSSLDGARLGWPLGTLFDDIDDLCERSAREVPLDDPAGWDGLDADGVPVARGLSDDDPKFIANKASLDTFVQLLDEFLKALPDGDLEAFEGWAEADMAKREAGLRGNAVALSSIHRAKGMEWPVVFVIGCIDGALPNWRDRTQPAEDESRRLAYVALTRASDELQCTWSKTRLARSGRIEETRPSPFLRHLPHVDGSAGIVSAEPPVQPCDLEIGRHALQEMRRQF
ncbi:MAG: ATP-dependent helicase [Actinomycetota bacterium]|nr:ATP-dependent helicase [Actinomycetota bacterium]